MRYETQTVRIGEALGPIDWTSPEFRERPEHEVTRFREMAVAHANGKNVLATTDGGVPRVGWHEVLCVEMYDGWPHWRPFPSFQSMGPLGPEWHSFYMLTDWREKSDSSGED